MRRLTLLSAAFFLGLISHRLGLEQPLDWPAGACLVAIGVLWAVYWRRAAIYPSTLAWLLISAGTGSAGLMMAPTRVADAAPPPGVARTRGVVGASIGGQRPAARFRITDGYALADGTRFVPGGELSLRGMSLPEGSQVQALVRVSRSQRFINPSPHPAWPGTQDFRTSATLLGPAELIAAAPPLSILRSEIRARVRHGLRTTLSTKAAGLCRALVVGEPLALQSKDREVVRDAGLSHVLAVSGLHVGLLGTALVMLLRLLFVALPGRGFGNPQRLAKATAIVAIPLYASLVGSAPSVWRATLTLCIGWGVSCIGRRPQPVAVAATAALCLLVAHPTDALRPAFLLSIIANAALISADSTGGAGLLSWARSVWQATFRATVATAPLVIWIFGGVPLIGFLANITIVPVAALTLLPLAGLHTAIVTLEPALGVVTAWPVEICAQAFLDACEFFSLVSWGRALPPPSLLEGWLLVLVSLVLLIELDVRRRLVLVLLLSGCLGAAEWHLRRVEQPRGSLRLTQMDVGQGDGALLDLPDGRLMVIDAGGNPQGGWDPGARAILPLLRARRRSRIDVLVISHPHPDHYGGMGALLEGVEIGEIWDTGQGEAEDDGDGELSILLERARALSIPILTPDSLCAAPRHFGELSVSVLWPCPGFDGGYGPNDNSFALDMRYRQRRLLFLGDLEEHGELSLLSRVDRMAGPRVDVLKVAHHGSRTSSHRDLLRALAPRIMLVSAGRQNSFGHPHPEVWERLDELGCALRTDRHGGVTVEIDDDSRMQVTTALGERPRDCSYTSLQPVYPVVLHE